MSFIGLPLRFKMLATRKATWRAAWLVGVGLLLFIPSSGPLSAAEVRLRESLLQQQRNRATITIDDVVVHIGHAAHSLSSDCDLHVPIRSRDVKVALMGELKNACSIRPAGTSNSYWAEQVYDETHGRDVQLTGVFRLWLEHPPYGTEYQSEAKRVEWYKNSNPDQVVEIHPITQIGSLNFSGHVKGIEQGTSSYQGYGPSKLKKILKKDLVVQTVTSTDGNLVRIKGKKRGYNHWNLTARVDSTAQAIADGHRITITILDNGQPVNKASNLPAVTVSGTQADTEVQSFAATDLIDFQALIRLDLNPILDSASTTETTIELPVEFILLEAESH